MTHDELQLNLAEHLRGGTDRMVWCDTQLGPVGSPRPDVFTVNKSFARFRTDAYEIKISVSDLRSDVTSGKWQSYRKFSNAVWFAFPKSMVPLDLIPKECGVICRSADSGVWRALRKPVAQVLDTLPRDAWLKLLMSLHPVDTFGNFKPPRRGDDHHGQAVVRKKLGDRIAELFNDVSRSETILQHRKSTLDTDIAEIDKQKAAHRAMLDADAVRLAKSLDDGLLKLGAALGLKADECDSVHLLQAVSGLRHRLEGNGVAEAIRLLEGLRGTLPANDAGPHRYRGGY